jgi:hypothetical protein
MAIVTPGSAQPTSRAPSPHVISGGTCSDVVAASVRLAQANDIGGAERLLAGAAACPAAARELAGIRVTQKRWVEAEELAASAIAGGDTDMYAWQVLATSRFVQNDSAGALQAWNRIGEPRLDLVRIDGLSRTRHRVVERLIDLPVGSLLTNDGLLRGRRRLAELPSSSTGRLDYVPLPAGLAEIRGFVAERPLFPSTPLGLTALALTTASTREVRVATGSFTGGGEQIWGAWRFWPGRPQIAGGVDAPAPWGGVWGIEASTGRQEFTSSLPRIDRRSARLHVADWVTGRLRLGLSGGMDERSGQPVSPVVSGSIRYASGGERFMAELANHNFVREGFASFAASFSVQSSAQRRGLVWAAAGTAVTVGAGAPLDLWPAGDTGHARSTLLRAHPLLDGGKLRANRLGRELLHATAEVQRWQTFRGVVSLAGALFVDAARTSRMIDGGSLGDVDAGVGTRLAIAGVPGAFRVDLARGLHDSAHAVSIAYER